MSEYKEQELIRKAKLNFINKKDLNPAGIRTEILNSWKRTFNYDISKVSLKEKLLSADELNDRITRRKNFYDIAVHIIEGLNEFSIGSGYMSLLSDEEGYMLLCLGNKEIQGNAKNNYLIEGCNRSESRLGTNAIGTSIIAKEPVQVIGEEHFFSVFTQWSCTAAPIFYPDGSIAGVFGLSGPISKANHLTLSFVTATAETITRQLKLKKIHDDLQRAKDNIELMGEVAPSGLILLDSNLNIIQLNRKALQLLQKKESDVINRPLDSLFSKTNLDGWNVYDVYGEHGIFYKTGKKAHHFTAYSRKTKSNDYIIVFEPNNELHQRINRLVGSEAHFSFDDIIGSSDSMSMAVKLAKVASKTDINILLTGENGTGKELFAQSIHNASERKEGPFITINCGALPRSLIESELFGYEGGSFTGSKKEGNVGKFELANGGTIFLDEIGEMPFDAQAALLRVLENKEIVRIGATKTIKIDVRIISATNKDLPAMIREGVFREDLYYRLNVLDIHIPALRDRGEDIKLLADYFIKKYSKGNLQLSDKSYHRLKNRLWPGNVRELENHIEKTVHLMQSGLTETEIEYLTDKLNIGIDLSDKDNLSLKPEAESLQTKIQENNLSLKDNECICIKKALSASCWNVQAAAKKLGISRRTIYRKMEKYNIKRNV